MTLSAIDDVNNNDDDDLQKFPLFSREQQHSKVEP
jgi:hypothetical protein